MVGTVEVVDHKEHKTKMWCIKKDGKSRPMYISPTKAKIIYDHIDELKDFVEKFYDPDFKGYTNEPQSA